MYMVAHFYQFNSSSLEDFIKTIRLLVNGKVTLEIRRSNLLQDAMKEARKEKFQATKLLKVLDVRIHDLLNNVGSIYTH